jgi:hypothetical protein
MVLSDEQLAFIDNALNGGNLIAAIREYRRFTGSDLAAAKQFVDSRQTELLNTHSNASPMQLAPRQPDPAIKSTIKPVSDLELRPLRYILSEIETLLYGINYQVTLSANAARLPHAILPVIETMMTLYPGSEPESSDTKAASVNELKAVVTDCLQYEGDSSSGPEFNNRKRTRLNDNLLPDLWAAVNAILPLKECNIISYSSDVGIPGYPVYWFFAYLIHCSKCGRCLVLAGTSSD